jgi:starch phosphorylase
MIRSLEARGIPVQEFPEHWAVQLNDTHPSIAVAELMRLLLDEKRLDWEDAWAITTASLSYTNHTLLPEALEKWGVDLMGSLLPRHLEIIYEINRRFLDSVNKRYPGDNHRLTRMSLIDEGGQKYVRMANLACVGSHAINGVAALHTELVKQDVLRDFYDMMPEKFSNKTNGVSPRRFMGLSNPGLSALITSSIGDRWMTDLSELKRLEAFADDQQFQEKWRHIKLENKRRLTGLMRECAAVDINPESMFDILVKRIHEYKRQHLLLLYIITLYNRIKASPSADILPRTFTFSGKAAPGYAMAKLIIKLINSVADVVNRDPDIRDRLKVVFVPDFSVKIAQFIYPAADLSEQISTAGKEASGTGNMKFAMNGALTIGTLDGANIEIRAEVGAENFFLFGLTAEEVLQIRSKGYRPWELVESDEELRTALDQIRLGAFSGGGRELFRPLVEDLLNHDEFLVLADYRSYVACQDRVAAAYRAPSLWTRMAILNTARMGKFSSDRAIREYCRDIWHAEAVTIDLETPVG